MDHMSHRGFCTSVLNLFHFLCDLVKCCRPWIYFSFLSCIYTLTLLLYNILLSDPTLTTYNVVEMTKSLGYDNLHTIFNASYGKYSEIREQYQSDEQRCEALIAHALATHPCISWNVIADRLQKRGYNEDAAEITRKYVKGQWILQLLG